MVEWLTSNSPYPEQGRDGGQAVARIIKNIEIEGLDFFGNAVPVDDIGRADGHELDVLIGALVMEQWEIRLDRKNGTLDLEGLRRREFTEF